MGNRTKEEKKIMNKMIEYIILKQITENGCIDKKVTLYNEYFMLAEKYDLKHKHTQALAINENSFNESYDKYTSHIQRFKIALSNSGNCHIVLYPIDILYLHKENLINLSWHEFYLLARPHYSCINTNQQIKLTSRYNVYTPYLINYLSTSDRIFFVSKSINNKGYLLQFNTQKNYDYFKSASTKVKQNREYYYEQIQSKLDENIETWLEPLQEHYCELHADKLNELKKSFDFEIPD